MQLQSILVRLRLGDVFGVNRVPANVPTEVIATVDSIAMSVENYERYGTPHFQNATVVGDATDKAFYLDNIGIKFDFSGAGYVGDVELDYDIHDTATQQNIWVNANDGSLQEVPLFTDLNTSIPIAPGVTVRLSNVANSANGQSGKIILERYQSWWNLFAANRRSGIGDRQRSRYSGAGFACFTWACGCRFDLS